MFLLALALMLRAKFRLGRLQVAHRRFEQKGSDDALRLSDVARTQFRAFHLGLSAAVLGVGALAALAMEGLAVVGFLTACVFVPALVLLTKSIGLDPSAIAGVTLFARPTGFLTFTSAATLKELSHSTHVQTGLEEAHKRQDKGIPAREFLAILRHPQAFWPDLDTTLHLSTWPEVKWRLLALRGVLFHAGTAGVLAFLLAVLTPVNFLPPLPSPFDLWPPSAETQEQKDRPSDETPDDPSAPGDDDSGSASGEASRDDAGSDAAPGEDQGPDGAPGAGADTGNGAAQGEGLATGDGSAHGEGDGSALGEDQGAGDGDAQGEGQDAGDGSALGEDEGAGDGGAQGEGQDAGDGGADNGAGDDGAQGNGAEAGTQAEDESLGDSDAQGEGGGEGDVDSGAQGEDTGDGGTDAMPSNVQDPDSAVAPDELAIGVTDESPETDGIEAIILEGPSEGADIDDPQGIVTGTMAGDSSGVAAQTDGVAFDSNPFSARGVAPEGIELLQTEIPDFPDNLPDMPKPSQRLPSWILQLEGAGE